MLISELNLNHASGVSRVEAKANWEDGDWPQSLFFADVEHRFSGKLWPDPNAFLIACFFRGWRAGERRIKIDAPICPVLFNNLKIVADKLVSWYPDESNPPPLIEADKGFNVHRPSAGQALSLLSCGIDSLATLRTNKTDIPSDHPDSIQAAVMVTFDDQLELSLARLLKVTAGRMAAASRVGKDAGVEILPVRTNLWWPGKAGNFFSEKAHGGIFCALASFLSGGFNKAYIASSYEAKSLRPWGSHPLLDPFYSTAHFRIEHHGMHMSRSEKISVVAEWPAGLQNIRVCQNEDCATSNCGTCRKCIKTMTVLLSLGKLQRCRAFPQNNVDAALLQTMDTHGMIDSEQQAAWCRSLMPVFQNQGRDDLMDALNNLAISYAKKQKDEVRKPS